MAGVTVQGRIPGPGTGVACHRGQEREEQVSPVGRGGMGSLSLQAGGRGGCWRWQKWRGREGRHRSQGYQFPSLWRG